MLLSLRSRRAGGRSTSRPAWPYWLVLGLAGWIGVVGLGSQLLSRTPPRAGFDLELLLEAGRRVAAGASPYDASILAGRAPTAVELFYSYPPPVAQYLSLFADVPSAVMLLAWGAVATLGLLAVVVLLARLDDGPHRAGLAATMLWVGLPVLAIAPFVFPFAIAALFGNLDALFPVLYGLMLVGALGWTIPSRFAGGAALAIASIAKLHPASMGLWFLARGLRDRRLASGVQTAAGRTSQRSATPGGWVVVASAAAVGLVVLGLSYIVGGAAPWSDYVSVLRAGAASSVVDVRNIAPAAQVALIVGGDESLARLLQIGVSIAALGGTVGAAWYVRDTVESFAWATTASLVILPVTWFHYPVALMPIALVAWLRADPAPRPRVAMILLAAIALGIVSIGYPVAVWGSVALVLLAVHAGIPAGVSAVPLPVLKPARISRAPLPGSRG